MLVHHSRMNESIQNPYSNKSASNSLTDETQRKSMGGVVLILHSNIVERYKL